MNQLNGQPIREPQFQHYTATPHQISATLLDGRTVVLLPDGRLQIYTPDLMHGSQIEIPKNIEWGGTHDVDVRRIEDKP